MMRSSRRHSGAWVSFCYAAFAASVLAVGAGIWCMAVDGWQKGFLAMGVLTVVQTCVSLTKTIRDNDDDESRRGARIEGSSV